LLDPGLALQRALGLDHPKASLIGPLLGLVQAVEWIEDKAAPSFEPTVILLHGLGKGMGRARGRDREEGEDIADRLGQGRLILFER
jgi:hypothetical protein